MRYNRTTVRNESSPIVGPDAEQASPFGPDDAAPLSPDAREHAANVSRMRLGLTVGTVVWLSFLALDWLMTRTVCPRSFAPVFFVRVAVVPCLAGASLRLHRSPSPSRAVLAALDVGAFAGASLDLGVLASLLGGMSGPCPYTPGVLLVLVARSAFMVQPWQRTVLPSVVIVASHFVGLYGADWLRYADGERILIAEPVPLLALHIGSMFFCASLLAAASHTTWVRGRRVFAARNLGRYRLETLLGEGGHGQVWKAYHAGLQRFVAIKVLRSEIAEDERAIARFEREIAALCRLRHPNTVRIFDYGVAPDGVHYYAMELLEGQTLAELVRDCPLTPSRAVHVLLQVAHALTEAHARGLLHRDVKPENIFVLDTRSQPDFVKLIDFGIAKEHLKAGATVTRTGAVVGTPAFMAPEILGGSEADARSDIYSLGATGYFSLVGCMPTPAAIEDGVRAGLQALRKQPDGLPIGLERVLLRCLERSPMRRYQSVTELASDLRALRFGVSSATGAVPSAEVTRTLPRRDG